MAYLVYRGSCDYPDWFLVEPCMHWYIAKARRPAVACEKHKAWWSFADRLIEQKMWPDPEEIEVHLRSYEEMTGCGSCRAIIRAQIWDVACDICQPLCEAGRYGYQCPVCPSQAACGRYIATSVDLLRKPVLVDLNFPPRPRKVLMEEVEKFLCL